MAKFDPGVPVVTSTPRVAVDVDPAKPLPVGRSRFRLVVVDDAGNESTPADLEIIIRDDTRPTAVLDVTDGNGTRLSPTVGAGKPFFLSGECSFDAPPGKIKEYRFTLLPPP